MSDHPYRQPHQHQRTQQADKEHDKWQEQSGNKDNTDKPSETMAHPAQDVTHNESERVPLTRHEPVEMTQQDEVKPNPDPLPETDNKDKVDPQPSSGKPGFKLAQVGTDAIVSYDDAEPVRNDLGMVVHNGHSVLHKVGGQEVWLHAEHVTQGGGTVSMPIWHARDVGLPVPE